VTLPGDRSYEASASKVFNKIDVIRHRLAIEHGFLVKSSLNLAGCSKLITNHRKLFYIAWTKSGLGFSNLSGGKYVLHR